jgi:hypothetical protein
MTDTRNVSPPRFGWRRRCAGVRLNHSVSPGSLASLSVRTRPRLDQDVNCPAHRADRLGASWLHEFAASVFSHTTLFLRNSRRSLSQYSKAGFEFLMLTFDVMILDQPGSRSCARPCAPSPTARTSRSRRRSRTPRSSTRSRRSCATASRPARGHPIRMPLSQHSALRWPAGGGRSLPRSGWAVSRSRPGVRGFRPSRRASASARPRSGCSWPE